MSLQNRIRVLTTVLLSLLVGACAQNTPFDPNDPRLENARLEIIGSSALNLRFAATAELHVRYVDGEGEVIPNAPIAYMIEGDAAGSRLVAFETTTNEEGEASMTLTAGSNSVIFDVTVTPPRGDGVVFAVSVSDAEAGSIVVDMSYGGAREFIRFDAFVFSGQRCTDMDPLLLPTALRPPQSVTSIDQRPGFPGIPVGNDYTIAVVARNASAVAGFGCRDSQAVVNNEETEVSITIQDTDIAPNFANVWDLDNRFDFGGALPESVDTVLNILAELTDDTATVDGCDPSTSGCEASSEEGLIEDPDGDGVWPEFGLDPGAFVVDMAMRQTCAWECTNANPDYGNCNQENHGYGDLRHIYQQNFQSWDGAEGRFFGGCGAWEFFLADAQGIVNNFVYDPSNGWANIAVDWLNLIGDLSRAITDARIQSVLTINAPTAQDEFILPITHELVQMTVPYRDPTATPPMMREATFLLADAGFTSLEVTESVTVTGTMLTIPEHSFNLNWGELVLYIYRSVLLPAIFGVNSTGELLAEWVNCNTVAMRLIEILDAQFASHGRSLSEMEGYCQVALDGAGSLLEEQLADALDAEGTLTISGTANGTDVDEASGEVGTLSDGAWLGTFGDGTTSRPISGTFTGTRRTE